MFYTTIERNKTRGGGEAQESSFPPPLSPFLEILKTYLKVNRKCLTDPFFWKRETRINKNKTGCDQF
jgi:hypothetical protein